MACTLKTLAPPKIVAIATDKYLTPTHASIDPTISSAGGVPPKYGQDFTFSNGRKAPEGHNVGKTEAELKTKMEKLINVFASKDKTGMAKRLFKQFLAKQSQVIYFDDGDLGDAAVGITAWWQLQHQFSYAPLVTRIVIEKTYNAPGT